MKTDLPTLTSEQLNALLDDLIRTEEGQKLIRARWEHVRQVTASEARAQHYANEQARRASPPPLEGSDCTVCGWAGDSKKTSYGGTSRCPQCHCLHGLRSAR